MLDLLRLSVISLECLCVLIAWLLWWIAPEKMSTFGGILTADKTLFTAILGAPLLMLFPTYKLARDVAFPISNSQPLAQWPGYNALVRRVFFAITIVVLAALGAIGLMLLWTTLPPRTIGALTLCFVGPPVCAVLSLAFASFVSKRFADELERIGPK